jgi:hypothetical protein
MTRQAIVSRVAGATLGRIDRERWLLTGLISIASFFWLV